MASLPPAPFLLAVRGQGFGAETEPVPGADAAAWSLVALLVLCLGGLAAMAWSLRRRSQETPDSPPDPAPERLDLPPLPTEQTPAWQKPADWWKQES